MDIVGQKKRSEMMAGIKGKDTKPELQVRKLMHGLGYRYKLHDKSLPGKPDLVFPKYKAVIQVQGCFWHRHNCHLFKWPSSRPDFWREKITSNVERDALNLEKLTDLGLRTLTIWECALKGKEKIELRELGDIARKWLQSDIGNYEIRGQPRSNSEN
jgi:DNA mismatch endonuclease, patch repair protein